MARVRLRTVARHGSIGTVALAVLLVVALYWLFTTIGGRDFLLARIKGVLPAGSELAWSSAEGPAQGPLTLHDVRFVYRGCPDVDGKPVRWPGCTVPQVTTFTAKVLVLDPALRPLLGRRLQLDALAVRDARLDLPRSQKPFELPRWPQSLPQVKPPVALWADAINIEGLAVTRAGVPMVDFSAIGGGLRAEDGLLHLERMVADSDRGRFMADGDYAPRDNYAMDITASAVLPAPLGRTRPALGLVARGDITRMQVALGGHVPDPLKATLVLRGNQARPTWQLRASSTALDPSLLAGTGTASEPVAFDLAADGLGGAANLRGDVKRGNLEATLQPSVVRIQDQTLALAPVVIDTFGGRITATGNGDFSKANAGHFSFAVNARGMRWGQGKEAVGASADFGIAGRMQAWAAVGRGVLVRDGQQARVTFDGRGDPAGLSFDTLRATMPQGRLDAKGRVALNPSLHWNATAQLAGFDPGYFAAGWNGAVNGTLATEGGTRASGGMDIRVDAQHLGGSLRGRALAGRATVAIRTPATAKDSTGVSGDIAMTLGASHVDARGSIDRNFDVDAKLSPLHLDDLLPSAAGMLAGTLRLTGPRNAPDIDADLSGSGVRYASYRADRLQLKGRLPWSAGRGDLRLTADNVQAGLAFAHVDAHAVGAMEDLQLTANATGSTGRVSLAGSARRQGTDWHGTLASLHLEPPKGAAWTLQSPAAFVQRGGTWALSPACFGSSAGGRACASADWPRRGLHVEGTGLPLALLLPYLPPRADGHPWQFDGEVALQGDVRPVGGSWRGNVHLVSPRGGLRLDLNHRATAVEYGNLVLDATFDPNRVQARVNTTFNGSGTLAANMSTGWDARAPLSGTVDIDTRDLTLMELLSPDIVDPTGHLNGHLLLGGTLASPALGGDARLTAFRTELPALGIVLQDGSLQMTAQADGNARISGTVRSGDGTLSVDGTLGWRGQGAPLRLNVRGKNVLVSDTRDLRAVVDPDVAIAFQAGQPITVSGTVGISSARIALERLDQGVTRSSDVVVLDPVDPGHASAASSSALDLDLALSLGNDVQLQGFGLDGTLRGRLRVRARPGRETVATGTLNVAGRYRAYGQNLQITRGRLLWSNDPVNNPELDVRAEREVGDVTAGINVTGRATQPQADVWSDPASSQTDALAYLTMGRPLSGLDSTAQEQVSAASAALSAGGSLLASQLGAKIGLDDAGVMQSRALGGSVLGVGKYLSPRLYVGYGVSLLGTGQVLMLKYLLRKGFDIQIESSSVENRASVNWRKEK